MSWTIPYTFASQSGNVPVSEIDSNFSYTAQSQQQQLATYAVDTGSTNAYSITLSPAPTLVDGSYVSFRAASTNTSACTLQINGGTAYNIYDSTSNTLNASMIRSGSTVVLVFNSTLNSGVGGWVLQSFVTVYPGVLSAGAPSWTSAGVFTASTSTGGNSQTFTNTAASSENGFSFVSTSSSSGTSFKLANSGTNVQASARLNTTGSLDFYVGQTSGASSTSGVSGLSITTAGAVTFPQPQVSGYVTGSGGTVTQATSKSTAVTLNKPAGQITMNNAALAANGFVSFTLNNSLIGTADVVLVNYASGGTTTAYTVRICASAAGSCVIGVQNVTGGSLSEAIVLNFVVIKGATA